MKKCASVYEQLTSNDTSSALVSSARVGALPMAGAGMWHSASSGDGHLRICVKISMAGGTVEESGSIVDGFCGCKPHVGCNMESERN